MLRFTIVFLFLFTLDGFAKNNQVPFRWARQTNCNIPLFSMTAGRMDGEDLYICRAKVDGLMRPGILQDCNCNVAYEGEVYQMNRWDIGIHDGRKNTLQWVMMHSNRVLPEQAIIGGQDSDGEDLLICRGEIDGTMLSGTVVDCNCNIAYEGEEHSLNNFEVLANRESI